MELEILKAVKAAGAHIAEHGKVTDKWNQVNDLVFQSDLFQQFKQDHYRQGNSTKVKSKYDSLVAEPGT